LVSATGNASYANLSVNTNLIDQLRSRNRPLAVGCCYFDKFIGLFYWLVIASGVYFHSWPVSVSRHLTLHSWKSLSLQNHVVKRMVR